MSRMRRWLVRFVVVVALVLAVVGILVLVGVIERQRPANLSVAFGPIVLTTNGVKALRLEVSNVSENGPVAHLSSGPRSERADGSLVPIFGTGGVVGLDRFSLGPGETLELAIPESVSNTNWRAYVSLEKEAPIIGPIWRMIPPLRVLPVASSAYYVVTNSPAIRNGAFVDGPTPSKAEP